MPDRARRAFAGWVALAAAGCGCSERSPGADASASARPAPRAGWHGLAFEASADQPEGQRAEVFAPEGSAKWPVLVALHGRGEAGRGLERGARGWRDDYDLDLVREALERGSLTAADVHGMLSEERLGSIRASLEAAPWRGLVVACPYTPVPQGEGPSATRPFGAFLAERLLPRVAEVTNGAVDRAATGIDGVSMGGRWALELGFDRPEVFGAVGALQPAIRKEEASTLADRALRASERGKQHIRLVSSSGDPFLEPTMALAAALEARKLEHQLIVTGGPHDYVWNRGPGAAEMLVFHERVLRGLPAAG